MEARSSLKGAGVSKSFVAAVLVIVAIGLGVMGAYLAANLSGSKAAAHHQTTSAPAVRTVPPDSTDRNSQLSNRHPEQVRPQRFS
jgi:hypothetical protein